MDKITVSDLVSQIKKNLEASYSRLLVEGEISNLSRAYSGHCYFTLSDADASVSCALFRGNAARNPLIKSLVDGDKVVVSGDMGVYVKRGTFQIIIKSLVKSGRGDLKEEFEKLKMRLAQEGLFDSSKKKALPKIPQKIAVITAVGGAALQDFLNVFHRRSLFMNILVVPSLVQGDKAPNSLRSALAQTLRYSSHVENIDVIVMTRGGGSLEDLWAFNDEGLVYDIFHCPIPVVSAVGHQVDESLSDFAADLRCETPTAAAEYLSQYQTTLKMRMHHMNSFLRHFPHTILENVKEKFHKAHPRFQLQYVKDIFHTHKQTLEKCNLSKRMGDFLNLGEIHLRLDELAGKLEQQMGRLLTEQESRVESLGMLLKSLNPSNVLSRGFSYVTDKEGHVISTIKDFHGLSSGASLDVTFRDGRGRVRKA